MWGQDFSSQTRRIRSRRAACEPGLILSDLARSTEIKASRDVWTVPLANTTVELHTQWIHMLDGGMVHCSVLVQPYKFCCLPSNDNTDVSQTSKKNTKQVTYVVTCTYIDGVNIRVEHLLTHTCPKACTFVTTIASTAGPQTHTRNGLRAISINRHTHEVPVSLSPAGYQTHTGNI